ncbi:hypothetical protein LXL04_034322 [Taraxacum kok-saghyz]
MIDKLDGSDFGFWIIQIEDLLYQEKLHEPLSKTKPENMKDDDRVIGMLLEHISHVWLRTSNSGSVRISIFHF